MKFQKLLLSKWSSLFPGQILKNKLAKFPLMSAEGKAKLYDQLAQNQQQRP